VVVRCASIGSIVSVCGLGHLFDQRVGCVFLTAYVLDNVCIPLVVEEVFHDFLCDRMDCGLVEKVSDLRGSFWGIGASERIGGHGNIHRCRNC